MRALSRGTAQSALFEGQRAAHHLFRSENQLAELGQTEGARRALVTVSLVTVWRPASTQQTEIHNKNKSYFRNFLQNVH